jgi:hypothetical protein
MYRYSFKKEWLEDPSCYPMITIMSFISLFLVGMSANAFTHLKDLRINPSKKHETLQTWGAEHQDHTVQHFANGPIIMNKKGYRSLTQEGLGYDHEQYLKSKEAYNSQ